MDEKTKELVGIAASIAGHCQPCFIYHLKEAEKLKIPLEDIREAIEFAKAISQSGDKNMVEFAERRLKKR
ncbi:MAG: alkylhydroperoxidase AhpD family core domain protein [Euryarchaeota archaeon CG01_land_8_20_14_3_00_38_12]|nr:MAG: alkylhydroperoxidase AhpD family core domain protein [Euryarchaeota archaeon CG01_land_8_20_14_3_00_38_12]